MAMSRGRTAALVAGTVVAIVLAGITRPGDAVLSLARAPKPAAAVAANFSARPVLHQVEIPELPPPTAAPTAAPAAYSGHYSPPVYRAPQYPVVYRISIPSVSINIPVLQVGLTSKGAMEAPEGAPNSAYWHEGFWLGLTAHAGDPGTMTVAGHLDDTLGRPAGFWTLRDVQPGAEVDITRVADGAVFRYRISQTGVYTKQQATQQPTIGRLYGPPGGGVNDGVPRISLITCTGRFVNGEYDHRFLAFGELITG